MKIILTILSFVIWIGSFWICEYFFSESIEYWWKLRMILYAVTYFLMTAANNISGKSKALLFFNYLFMGLIMEDITDRLFFDIRHWEPNDFIAIDFSLAIALFLTFKRKRDDVGF